MHFVLVPTGSAGDVYPYLGIGGELKRRGHTVTIVTAEPFRQAAEATGASFVSHQSEGDYRRLLENPDMWDPRKGLSLLLGALAGQMEEGLGALERACGPGAFLVGHSLSFHARVYEELHGNRAVTIHLAPSAFRSNQVMPAAVPGYDMASLPSWMKRALWRAADGLLLDRAILPQFNPWRASKGLPPVRQVFGSWLHSPQGAIGLFPDWFALRQPDWHSPLTLTGFPLFDRAPGWVPDQPLQSFLDAGERPVLFAHGTANQHAAEFFAAAIAGTERIGRRAILQTAFPNILPPRLPNHVHHIEYAPFSRLLPSCDAIVHHGGIGTSSQGLAAGLPQLIVPMAFDQPDNTTHLMRLGVADWIWTKRLTPARLGRKLQLLLTNPDTAEQCARWKARLQATRSLEETADVLEKLASPP